MPISSPDTETQRHRRSRRSSDGSSSGRSASPRTTEPEEASSHRRSKRSSGSSSPSRASRASHRPRWAILNRIGAQRDDYYFDGGDHTTSSTSLTTAGDGISVSFELVEPPGVSLLTIALPRPEEQPYPDVVAADGPLVLFFWVACREKLRDYPLVNYFVYNASCRDPSGQPSLTRLPSLYGDHTWNGRPLQHNMPQDGTGLLCCSKRLFIVASIEGSRDSSSAVDMYLWLSGSDEWKVLRHLHVSGSRGRLSDWCPETVVPYRNRFLIWADYFTGMIVADMAHPETEKPRLRYVPLPVGAARDRADDWNVRQGHPETSRSLCVTRSGIKFVCVVNQPSCCFAAAKCRHRSNFRICTWSLRDDDYTWREEATLDGKELWALDTEDSFPHIVPEFPVVNMEDPDAICFLLNDHSDNQGNWMIEVDMKKKELRAVSAYPNEKSLSRGFSFVSSELPCYLYDGEACKKRRKSKRQEYD